MHTCSGRRGGHVPQPGLECLQSMIDVDVDVDTEASPAQSEDDDTADVFFAVRCAREPRCRDDS